MDSLFIMIDSISNEVEGCFIPSKKDLEGITFYVPDDKKVSLSVQGNPILFIENAKDNSGRRSISIPWNRLIFPEFLFIGELELSNVIGEEGFSSGSR